MRFFTQLREALLHLAFPHVCEGCGSAVLDAQQLLCVRCITLLPSTHFHLYADNPVEKIFWGRLPLLSATAHYYFARASLMQTLVHQLKYRNNQALGLYLGRLMGSDWVGTTRFSQIDALVPLPLFAARQKKRGYNQAALLCKGIAAVLDKPVWEDIVVRKEATESQTKKSRLERWTNMEGRFELTDPATITGKHLLLVDDVLTTGATLEACGRALLQAEGTRLSIATLCMAADN